jgi:hypothetical protein
MQALAPFQYCALGNGDQVAQSGDAPGITTCVSETGPRQDMGFLFSFKAVSAYAQDR